MVIEDIERVLVPLKLLGVRCIVSPQGGGENLGETRPLNLTPSLPMQSKFMLVDSFIFSNLETSRTSSGKARFVGVKSTFVYSIVTQPTWIR